MGLTALGMVGARKLTVGDARRPVALMTAGGCGQMIGPTVAGLMRDASGSFLRRRCAQPRAWRWRRCSR